jgi:ribosomal protein S8
MKKRKPNGYWNLENIRKEAKKYKNLAEFQRKSRSAYMSAWEHNVQRELFNKAPLKSKKKLNVKLIMKIVKSCNSLEDLRRVSRHTLNTVNRHKELKERVTAIYGTRSITSSYETYRERFKK